MDTSIFSHINWLAVGVATLAYFMLGAAWYTKILFGKQWITASGVDMSGSDAKKGAGSIMFVTLVLEFIQCLGIAILAYKTGVIGGVLSGIKLGLLVGGIFAGTSIMISYMYESKAGNLGLINAGYHLVGSIIAGIIICIW